MQLGASNVGLSSELFSANKVLRGTDVMVNSDNVFAGYTNASGGVGTTPCVSIYNPIGSGITLLIDRIEFMTTQVCNVSIGMTSTLLSLPSGAWTSQKSGLTVGTCQPVKDTATPASTGYFGTYTLTANQLVIVEPPFPFLCAPGKGVLIIATNITLATALFGNFYGREFTN